MPDPEATELNDIHSSNLDSAENEFKEFLEKSRNQKSALLKLLRFVEGKPTNPPISESDSADMKSDQEIPNNNSSLT